jgi:hypothetical protein
MLVWVPGDFQPLIRALTLGDRPARLLGERLMSRYLLVLVSSACLLCGTASGEERPRTVTVTGSGTVVAQPDKAQVLMTAQKSNADLDQAREDVAAVTQRCLDLTRKLGIDAKKVRTTGLIVNPEYRWEQQTSRQILVGYLVQRQIEVELADLDKLGELMEGAVRAGVNNVSPPQLDSSKRPELNRQALAAAAKDAEANARIIAETLGAKLGALRELTAGGAMPPPPPIPMLKAGVAMAEAAMDRGAETYTPGSLQFEATVNATFDLN